MFRKSEVVTSSLPQKVGKKVEKKNQAREKSSNARKKIEHAKKSSARKKIKHEFCMALIGLRSYAYSKVSLISLACFWWHDDWTTFRTQDTPQWMWYHIDCDINKVIKETKLKKLISGEDHIKNRTFFNYM